MPAAGFQSGRGIAPFSGADRVGHAFLGEARLGSAGKLLVGGRRIARLVRVGLALLHEAVERGAGELLIGSLRLAGWSLRNGTANDTTSKRNHQSGQYDHSHD